MKLIKSNDKSFNHIIKWCLDDILKLKNYKLKIKYGHFHLNGKFDCITNTIEINTLDRSKSSIIKTLFHELRHFYQIEMKMMEEFLSAVDLKTLEWYLKKETKLNSNQKIKSHTLKKSFHKFYRVYKKLPWEKDADQFSKNTYNQFKKI